MCFVLYICCISCEGVLASYSPLDRRIDPIISVKHELLSLMATDIALVNVSASLGSEWCHSAWAGRWQCQLQQPRDVPMCSESVRRSLCIQSWMSPVAETSSLPAMVRDNPGSTSYVLAPVYIILCFQLSVLKQSRAFSKRERIYNSMSKITNTSAVSWELWCDWKACMKWVSQLSPAVMFLFAVQLGWNLGALSSRGGQRCHRSYFHTSLSLSLWRSTCGKWYPACICLLALDNKQQDEMGSICSLNCCSLPVSRPHNREDSKKMQYISMSSGIFSSWIWSRVSKSMEQLLYCCFTPGQATFIIC